MSSFNRIVIDTSALAHNYRLLQAEAGTRVRVMAMVKSDGYGHSMVRTAAVLSEHGCGLFGVAEIEEGVVLRESGCAGEIVTFLGFEPADIDYVYTHDLTPVIFTSEDLHRLAAANKKTGTDRGFYLKFDCGMSRLGFDPEEAGAVFETCRELAIRPVGLMSHFPCSDDRASDSSRNVADIFERISLGTAGSTPLLKSICNSGGILYHHYSHGDMVRAGISIYGYYPDGETGRRSAGGDKLRPAMRFSTRVIQTRTIPAGTGVSYGHTFVSERTTRLATLPVGYSDGYLRAMSNRAAVLIKGRRAPIRGRICMNMCMADITDIEDVGVGDEAVLMGSQGNETIDADQIGRWSDTISYEVLCSLGNNNEREFVS